MQSSDSENTSTKLLLSNIGKRYRFEWIFRKINYEFDAANQYAILGANGTGKSTLLKILSGYLTPTKGTITFQQNGEEIAVEKVYKKISYAAPYIELIEEFTLIELLEFHIRFQPFVDDLTVDDVIERLNFQKSKNKEVRFFSSGMKQRLKLILALCTQSSIIFLDEPTTNLDQQGVDWYRDLVKTYSRDRLLIIASNIKHDYDFCTHHLNIEQFKRLK